MRKMLKKAGLTPVILVAIAAMAFLPKNVAQWVILATILFFAASKGVVYYLNHEDEFKRKKERQTCGVKSSKATPSAAFELKYALTQLSHRVTDKLHSAFPESTWYWTEEPTTKLFTDGGRVRIATSKTDDFNEADVILDTYGRIEIKMLKTNSVSEIVKTTDEKADVDFTVDTKMWYEQCGQKVLTDIITDLNARGTKVLCIKEDGSIVIDNDKQVGMLKAFPSKNLWKKLISEFEENGLIAVENENSIQIGW